MKNRIKGLELVAASLLWMLATVSVTQAADGGANAAEVRNLVELNKFSVDSQVKKKNLPGFAALLADDVMIISGDGSLATKDTFLKDLGSDRRTYNAIKIDEPHVNVYGNAAIVSGLMSATGTSNGVPFQGYYRYTKCLVKREGAWKIVSWQNTVTGAPK